MFQQCQAEEVALGTNHAIPFVPLWSLLVYEAFERAQKKLYAVAYNSMYVQMFRVVWVLLPSQCFVSMRRICFSQCHGQVW